MLPEKRRDYIIEKIKIDKSVLVKDLSEELKVTQETIRRDLQLLEEQGKLIKTHGGAFIRDGVNNDIDVRIRETIYIDAKERIGLACSQLVHDGETIILDVSTTSMQIARHIKTKRVTVLTNSLRVAEELSNSDSIKLVVLGGILDHHSLSFLGLDTINMLRQYYVDKAFISCRGIDKVTGVTDSNELQAQVRQTMLRQGKTNYLIIDKTKLDVVAFSRISEATQFDTVVIEELPDDWAEYFKLKGVNVLVAEP